MKKLLMIMALLVFLTGCGVLENPTDLPSAQNSVPTNDVKTTEPVKAADDSTKPVMYGLWLSDSGDIIVISESSVYLVQKETMGGGDTLRETWYEIQDIDWVNGVLTLKMTWVRVNGKNGGFDMPLHYMKVWIDGSILMYSMGDEGQGIPEEALTGPFMKK